MGIQCPNPKCRGSNTISKAPGVMWCKDCAKSWSPRNSSKNISSKTDKIKDKPFNIMEDTMLPEEIRPDF